MRHAIATMLMLGAALGATQALASYLASRPLPPSRFSEPYEPPAQPGPNGFFR